MKKILLASAVVALTAMTSCSNNGEGVGNEREIRFKTFVGKNSKGTAYTEAKLNQDFMVYAYWGGENVEADQATLAPNFMYNQHVVYNSGSNSFTYSPIQTWPATGDVNFYAYTPYTSTYISVTKPASVSDIGYPEFDYTVPDDIASQEDFMVAAEEDRDGSVTGVEFNFDHALTQVIVGVRTVGDYETNIGTKIEIIDATIKQVAKKGTFSYDRYVHGVNSTWWNVDNGTMVNYAIGLGSTPLKVPYYRSDDDGNNRFLPVNAAGQAILAMPQAFAANNDAELVVNYKVTNSSNASSNQSITFKLKDGVDWTPGTLVYYSISFTLNAVTFDANVIKWQTASNDIDIVPDGDGE